LALAIGRLAKKDRTQHCSRLIVQAPVVEESRGAVKRKRWYWRVLIAMALAYLCFLLLAQSYMIFLERNPPPEEVGIAKADLFAFKLALERFHFDLGRYPTADEGLDALWQKPARSPQWKGAYADAKRPLDPWEGRYIYEADPSGRAYVLSSLGKDGAEGGEGEAADLVLYSANSR
jgi:type II secretion system protein G